MGLYEIVRLGRFTQQPCPHDVRGTFALVFSEVRDLDLARRVECMLQGTHHNAVRALEACQHQLGNVLLMFALGETAIGHEHRVAGVIVPGMKIAQRRVGEIGNGERLATAVVTIDGVGKQRRVQMMIELRERRAHRALHLVVDHAVELERQRAILGRVGQFQTPALLREIERIEIRKEHRVEINLEQVVEILAILRGKRIGGAVAAGEGVHESVQ